MPIVNVTDISKDFVAEAIARMEKDIQTVARAHRGLSKGHEKVVREWQVLDAENATLRAKVAEQGLSLACLADGILGEDAEDRSDQTLVRVGCQLRRENVGLRKLLKLLSQSDQHPTVTVAEVAQYAKQGLAAIGEEAQP
jgi:regulator of replication initiation timing